MVNRQRLIANTVVLVLLYGGMLFGQIENVPVNNQVYEFLDRMGVKGILSLYSNAMIPLSRKDIAEFLIQITTHRDRLNKTEMDFLEKFRQEFMHEIDPAMDNSAILLKSGSVDDWISDKEKYLYRFRDSSASLYVEFIGSLEYRRISGDTYGSANSALGEYGGRIRGTIKNRLGYFLQATNGTMFGDRNFALSDPRLRGNVKLNDLDSPYFDFTEAYLRADLDWFNLQFGREHTLVGTGYSDRLLLSQDAPVFDFLKMDFHYKSFRFLFLHGSLVDPMTSSGKYLALHRAQFSLFECMNIGFSEMIIYQRPAIDFAYLNPINFYKSSEHSLRDRDNAFLNLDLEVFPLLNYKLYGTWLIDDIDFKKMGTGWWGNEFGWQGGIYFSDIAGIPNLDGVAEYTRIEPYVYSNRLEGNSYSNNNIGLGHHLGPNSDQWFIQFAYRPLEQLRVWITLETSRHGQNEIIVPGIIKNVGGDILQGHQSFDSEKVGFLDGNLVTGNRLQLRATYEFITNIFISGDYELRRSKNALAGETDIDHYGFIRFFVEY